MYMYGRCGCCCATQSETSANADKAYAFVSIGMTGRGMTEFLIFSSSLAASTDSVSMF